MATVRANQSIVVVINGSPQAVKDGDRYDTDDQVVKEFRWLFDAPVESATAAPGERRNVRRSS